MARSDEACQMLAAAARDFKALVGMTDPGVFADEVFGFHARQAVELALRPGQERNPARFVEDSSG